MKIKIAPPSPPPHSKYIKDQPAAANTGTIASKGRIMRKGKN